LIGGLIEAPDLAGCLTLSKYDFIRSGTRGASYLAYRKAIQEVVGRQLAEWGDAGDADARPRTVRLERDLERVLEDLADDFPLLRSLVDRRAGGQKRLPLPGKGKSRVPAPLFANLPAGDGAPGDDGASLATADSTTPSPESPLPPQGARPPSTADVPPARDPSLPDEGASGTTDTTPHTHHAASEGSLDTVSGRRRPARYGLLVQFESRPDDLELGRLVDSTIWINSAHPAFTRALASRSLGYHTALAVALALAPLAVDARDEHAFITQFLASWGSAHATARPTSQRRLP
jgi:hypothetical protein